MMKILMLGLVVFGVFVGIQKSKSLSSDIKFLQVRNVFYEGDIPEGLQQKMALVSGQNIFSFSRKQKKQAVLADFPELEHLTIQRTLNRDVKITGKYRTVVAIVKNNGKEKGMDASGFLFPMKETVRPSLPVPIVSGEVEGSDYLLIAQKLVFTQKKRPDFFALIKEIKTDKIFPTKIFLQKGIEIEWPDFETEKNFDQTDIVLRFLERYEPNAQSAMLRFVTGDRLIMDAHWKENQN